MQDLRVDLIPSGIEMTAHLNAVRRSQAEVGETVQYVKSALRPWERSPENDYVKEADPEDDERPEEEQLPAMLMTKAAQIRLHWLAQ